VVTHHSPKVDVAVLVMLAVGVYARVTGILLAAFGTWIAAGGDALLRYAGCR